MRAQEWLRIGYCLHLAAHLCLGGVSHETWLAQTTLPQQSRLCDVAGAGTVTGASDTHIDITVAEYWIGNPGSNTLHIVSGGGQMPVAASQTNIVFFATTNIHYQVELEDPANPFKDAGISPYHWDYPRSRTNDLASMHLAFIGGERGWFSVDEGNGTIRNFASNLVHHMRIQPDIQAYYNLLRNNGAGWTEPERIAQDVRYSLWMSSYFDGTNMLSLMATDTGLDPRIRSSATWRLNLLNPYQGEE